MTMTVTQFRQALDDATRTVFGTADIYAIPDPATRKQFVLAQRAWINAHADTEIPGWREGAADSTLAYIRSLSMSDWDFTVSYFNTQIGELPFDPAQTRLIGTATKPQSIQTDARQVWVTADPINNARAWYYQRPTLITYFGSVMPPAPRVVFDIRKPGAPAPMSAAEYYAWMNHRTDAANAFVAMSYLNQGVDVKVTPPQAYAIYNVSGAADNLHRNLYNTNKYFAAIIDQVNKLAAGQPIATVTPTYAVPSNSSNFWTVNRKFILTAFELVLAFYALPAITGKAIPNPFASVKTAVTDPVGTAQAAAVSAAKKATTAAVTGAIAESIAGGEAPDAGIVIEAYTPDAAVSSAPPTAPAKTGGAAIVPIGLLLTLLFS